MFFLLEEDNGDKFSPTKSGNSGDSRASQLASGKYIAPIAQITYLDHWIDEKPLQNSPYGAANHKHYVRIYSGIGGATSTRTNTSAVTQSSIGNWRNHGQYLHCLTMNIRKIFEEFTVYCLQKSKTIGHHNRLAESCSSTVSQIKSKFPSLI